MNQFTAKKIGEVLAFARIGQQTWEKGQPALATLWPGQQVTELIQSQKDHAESILKIAREAGVAEAVEAKAGATGGKLSTMRDGYVQDAWDDAAELMEWLGFFEGAAIVHWSLVQGAAEKTQQFDLLAISNNCLRFHRERLDEVTAKIKLHGQRRATEQ